MITWRTPKANPKKPMCSLEFSIENSTNKVGILKHGFWYVVMILANKIWMGSLLVDLKQHERHIIHFIGGGRAIHWYSNTPLEAVRQTFQPQSGRLRCNACFHLPVQVVWEKPSKNFQFLVAKCFFSKAAPPLHRSPEARLWWMMSKGPKMVDKQPWEWLYVV